METRSWPVSLDAMSPHVIAAVLAAEDRRFQEHGGLDFRAIARAALHNARALRVEQGGSTLTQQLARLLAADRARSRGEPIPRRSFRQKLEEAHLALRLESALDKGTLLEAFLNRAPFGHGAVGIEAAARRYFDVSAASLSAARAAWLVALIRGPSYYDPFAHPERVSARTERILAAMREQGHLTAEQDSRARGEAVIPRRHALDRQNVHALALARREWDRRGGGQTPAELPLTIDARLEETIRKIVRDEAPKIYRRGARSSAVVVLDNREGSVLAAVGATFEENPLWGQFSAVTSKRQPGSALKPFLYAAALADGDTAASLAADIERPFPDTWGIYKPKNYDELYHGPVRYRAALAQSLNVAAVDVLSKVGLDRFYRTLEAFGITTLERRPEHYGLGLTLGSAPVMLIDLANAYAALARGGEWRPWTVLRTHEGLADLEAPRRVLDRETAFLIGDMLADGNARAEQFGIRSILTTPYWAAAKTGTSKGYRDNWTFGFSAEVTVGVWVGDPTGKPMHQISGVEGAGTIWRRVMDELTDGASRAPQPPGGLSRVRICSVSGQRIGPHCTGGLDEWFRPGHAPEEPCSFHRHARIDPSDGGLVPAECRVPEAQLAHVTVYPSPYDAWAEESGAGRSARVSGRCASGSTEGATVKLLSPAPTEAIRLDPDVPLERQALTFRAKVEGTLAPVTFLVNGEPVAEVLPPYELIWPVRPGLHRVEARVSESARSSIHLVEVR